MEKSETSQHFLKLPTAKRPDRTFALEVWEQDKEDIIRVWEEFAEEPVLL